MIRALIADDEAPARDRLRDLLAELGGVEVAGEATDGEEALALVRELRPDVLFLDVQMPGTTGLEVAAALEPPRPRVVFTTAYDRYALDAFEHNAVDYLLKPLERARLARAVERVLREIKEREGLLREVAEAGETQARLLPRGLPSLSTLEVSGACLPARGVGGDVYDLLELGRGRLGLVVADVSGKGLYAGLLAAALQARLQALAPVHADSPAALARELARAMLASVAENRFATLFYGVYDDAVRTLAYVNAGHTPPLLARGDGSGEVVTLQPTGPVLGLVEGAAYREETIRIGTGDLLLAFTDGLAETASPSGGEIGLDGIAAMACGLSGRAAAEARDALLEAARHVRGESPQQDDVTLVVARGL